MSDQGGTVTVTTYAQRSAITGRHIRMATLVILEDGTQVKFMERCPSKREAIATARRWVAEGIA